MTSRIRVRVLIADDHGVVRAGLTGLLQGAGFDVVGAAATGRQAVEMAARFRPDVVLLDIRMPDMDGLQALKAIKTSQPRTAVIVFTTYANPEYLAQAVALGAAGYLTKETEPERIPEAVRRVAAGESILDHQMLQTALRLAVRPAETPLEPFTPVALTDQEQRVLSLIARGFTNHQIAEALSISRNTVKTHVRHIFEKLDVSDRTQAAVWALRHGVGG
ncbi:MAG: response regulator transcription factor [Chloroflexi bacterium]|nr:response regulator transcription factor [Chloroflexota bacterium]